MTPPVEDRLLTIEETAQVLRTTKDWLYRNHGKLESVVKTPGLSSPCTMQCCQGVLTAFGVGFTPHVQSQARTDLRLRAYPVDLLLPLAIAPVPTFHRIGRGGQPRVIEKRQGLFSGRGKELLEGFAHLWEPPEPTPQCGQFGQSGLGPTAPIEQRIHLVHDGPERV